MAEIALFSDDQKMHNWNEAFVRFVALFYFFQGFYHFGTSVYVLAVMANWGYQPIPKLP